MGARERHQTVIRLSYFSHDRWRVGRLSQKGKKAVSRANRILLALFLCLFFSNALCAQVDVSGRWRGTRFLFGIPSDTLEYDFVQNGINLTGTYLSGTFWGNASLTG